MNNSIRNQAFPDENNYGISIRDYFAARAMQSYMGDKEFVDACVFMKKDVKAEVARLSYLMADAMLEARDE